MTRAPRRGPALSETHRGQPQVADRQRQAMPGIHSPSSRSTHPDVSFPFYFHHCADIMSAALAETGRIMFLKTAALCGRQL